MKILAIISHIGVFTGFKAAHRAFYSNIRHFYVIIDRKFSSNVAVMQQYERSGLDFEIRGSLAGLANSLL